MTPDRVTGPPYGPNGETLGDYPAISSYSLSIGSGGSPPTDSGSVNPLNTSINVFDSEPPGFDQYEVFIPMQTGLWFMQLDDNTDTAFSSDALPCCGEIPLPLATRFPLARDFSLRSLMGGSFDEIRGSVDYHRSICIPEPTSLVLMCLACGIALLRPGRA
jgi:hypothetical protein